MASFENMRGETIIQKRTIRQRTRTMDSEDFAVASPVETHLDVFPKSSQQKRILKKSKRDKVRPQSERNERARRSKRLMMAAKYENSKASGDVAVSHLSIQDSIAAQDIAEVIN